MKLKELIDTSYRLKAIQIIIRENGNGKWIYSYKVGEHVQVGKFDWFYDHNGNFVESGRFFYPVQDIEVCNLLHQCKTLIIQKDISHIPKFVLNLEVCDWCFGTVVDDHLHHDYDCISVTCFPSLKKVVSDDNKGISKSQQLVFDFFE